MKIFNFFYKNGKNLFIIIEKNIEKRSLTLLRPHTNKDMGGALLAPPIS